MKLKPTILCVGMMSVALAGCGDGAPSNGVEEHAPMAYMSLSVSTVESVAGGRVDGYTFEAAESSNEMIHTMRFVIVDGDGNVEHNVSISQIPDFKTSPKRFRVKPHETKAVYLFGNETSIPEEIMTVFKNLKQGEAFPVALYETAELGDESGNPLFPNDRLIPMTEVHSVEIGAPVYNGPEPVPYQAELFVTRATAKLSFNLTVSESYLGFNPSMISTITFNKVGNKEYLFPKNTQYLPPKNPSSFDARTVTSFSVPVDAVNEPYVVTWIKGGDDRSYLSGPIYIPETDNGFSINSYSIVLPVGGIDLEATLPNLPSLPRNTHAKVDITLSGGRLSVEVAVVPYTGVYLNPEFGIDRD